MRSRRSRLLLPFVFVGLAAALGSTAGASVTGEKPSKGSSAPARVKHDDQVKLNAKAALRRVALVRVDHMVTRRIIHPPDLAVAGRDAKAADAVQRQGTCVEEPRVPPLGAERLEEAREAGLAEGAAAAALRPVVVHPPVRGQLGRLRTRRTTAGSDGSVGSSARTVAGCSKRRVRPTTGRRSSRCGWPSGHTRPAGASTPGPNPRSCNLF